MVVVGQEVGEGQERRQEGRGRCSLLLPPEIETECKVCSEAGSGGGMPSHGRWRKAGVPPSSPGKVALSLFQPGRG